MKFNSSLFIKEEPQFIPTFPTPRLSPTNAFYTKPLNPNVLESHQTSGDLRDILQLLVLQQKQSLVPPLSIKVFTGDATEYQTFKVGFESQIEERINDPGICLRYLDQYLQGPPKELIKGCFYGDPRQGYITAKRLLTEKYGDPYVISNAFIRRATELQNLKAGDCVAREKITSIAREEFNADFTITWIKNPPAASNMGEVGQIRTVRSILRALMRDYGHTLDDESFRTMMAEVECIVNSRPLHIQRPQRFGTTDAQQHPYHEVKGGKENFSRVYNLDQNGATRNFPLGDIVLVVNDQPPRNHWKLARVVMVMADDKGLVRAVTIKTSSSTYDRPIDKLVLLLTGEQDSIPDKEPK
ncbi:hypothetical protein AC249_AIPGENE25035 [Exaiptasia diaphana]|nr:hypothetical protein AC249_AIPGENE25035 [Exaiptasia diaphana]